MVHWPWRVFQCTGKAADKMKNGAPGLQCRGFGGAFLPVLAVGTGGERLPGRCRIGFPRLAHRRADRCRPGVARAAGAGRDRLEISERTTTILTLAYSVFFGLDYLLLSRDFLHRHGAPGVLPGGDEDPDRADESRLPLYGGDRVSRIAGGGNPLGQPELLRVSGAVPDLRDGGADQRGDPPLGASRPSDGARGVRAVSTRGWQP